MELKTYTNIWSSPRRMYSVGDMTLPQPVPLIAAAIFVLTAAVWMPLLAVLGVSFKSSIGLVAYFSLPVGLAWVGNKPIFEGKSIIQYVLSLISYLTEAKQLNRLLPTATPNKQIFQFNTQIWTPDEDHLNEITNPTPSPTRKKRKKRRRKGSASKRK